MVVPSTTAQLARDRIGQLGATVEVHGDVWDEANLHALTLAEADDVAYIPPFDHPDIWEGHATLVDELHKQLFAPVCCCIPLIPGHAIDARV